MKKTFFRIAVVGVFVALIAAGVTYLYVFRKAPDDLMKAKTELLISADDLYRAFETDEVKANETYVGKVMEVRGKVVGVESAEWGQTIVSFIDPFFGVTATIDSSMTVRQHDLIRGLSAGDSLTIKGRCDGMLTDVRLVKCFIPEAKN